MKYDEFKKAVDRIIEDEDTLMIHVSPDFQCDQTLGFRPRSASAGSKAKHGSPPMTS